MRDNHEGMIEFIDAFERSGQYFGIVEYQSERYQFGVTLTGYRALKKAMQIRKFDMMPGLKYRYFYVGSQKAAPDEHYWMEVRVELGRDATKERVDIPKELHANLLWMARLENMADAGHLVITK